MASKVGMRGGAGTWASESITALVVDGAFAEEEGRLMLSATILSRLQNARNNSTY